MGRYIGKTVLLVDIRNSKGEILSDHLWFKMGKGFDSLKLKPRDAVTFEATVGTYTRGGRDSDDYDFKLEYPRKLRKVEPNTLREIGQEELVATNNIHCD